MTATCQPTFSVTHLRNKSSVLSLGRALFWLQMQAEAHHLLFVTIKTTKRDLWFSRDAILACPVAFSGT